MERQPEGVTLVRADNPSPLTLEGTNSYAVGNWVVDPGPDDRAHLERLLEAAGGRIDGIVLTHSHDDHAGGAAQLAEMGGGAPVLHPGGGDDAGPFEVVPSPGHSADSVCLIHDRACFTGDSVLGAGSVFVTASLARYLEALRALAERDLEVICPGHGPLVWDPAARLRGYVEHRLDRERRLVAALEAGATTEDEMLDAAWDDAPAELRPAAALTLRAHLEKLREEGRI